MFFQVKNFLWVLIATPLLLGGCTFGHEHMDGHGHPRSDQGVVGSPSEMGVPLKLEQTALEAHQNVMQDHFKAIHEIVDALAEEDFEKAKDVTETRLGFAIHRAAMRQQKPENFPPAYHDLAIAHHEAAENLAMVIPSKDLKQILPHLERTLNACVQCHEKFTR